MNNPLRFALIGAGGIAQTHLQVFSRVPSAQLVAIIDTRFEAAQAAAVANHCKAFECVEAAIEECELDAAIVCTPPSTHPEICSQLSLAGIHILCEKPIAIELDSARTMLVNAEKSRTLMTMASKFRYVDDMIFAKQLITSGVIGDVLLFENTFAGHVDMTHRWNSLPQISGGGVLIDNGTHSVDIVRYLLGPIASIQTLEGKQFQDIAVEDTVRIHAKTHNGALAAMDLSWSINKQTPWYVSVYGTAGTILVGWRESKYKRDVDSDWTVFGKGYDKVQAFSSQLSNFCNAIMGSEQLLISAEDAIASVEAIQKAYESLRANSWISIGNKLGDSIRVVS